MPEYLAPGVYVEETDTGTKPIEGVSTSTCGMVGVTERGPVNVPILITSTGEFRRWFGELLDLAEFSNAAGPLCYLPHAIEGFFTNGGQRVYVTRIEHANATRAQITLRDRGAAVTFGTRLLRAAERGTGTVLSRPFVSVIDVAGINVGETVRIGAGSDAEYHEVVSAAPSRHVALVTGLDNTHAAGTAVSEFERAPDGAFAAFTVDLDVESGGTRLDLTETVAGQAAALAAAGGDVLLEFGTAPHATYRFVELAQTRSATQVRVELTAPLAVDVAAGDSVTVVQAPGDADVPGLSGFTLSADPTGLVDFDITETVAGDAATALAAVGTFVLVLDATDERVPVLAMVASGAAAITVTIAAPVTGTYAAGDAVTLRTTNVTTAASLETLAASGDAVLFVDDLDGAFNDSTHLVVVAPGTADQEVRRIGGLVELELVVGAYEDYASGSTARAVVLDDDDRTFAGVVAGIDSLVAVGDVSTIHPGQTLLVGPGSAAEEPAIVSAVDTGTSTITLTAGLANAHNTPGTDSFAVRRATTAAVEAGAGVVALDSRLGLAAGDVLRMGEAPDDEFAAIADLLGSAGDTPDPGSVVFTAPLQRDHAAGSAVRRVEVTAPGGGSHAVALALATSDGGRSVYLAEDDGFIAGGSLAITSTGGLVHYHTLSNAAAAVVPSEVELGAPLRSNQAAGSDFVQRNALLELHAIDSGGWGNRLRASVLDERQGLVTGAAITALAGLAVVTVRSLVGFEPGTVLEMIDLASDEVIGEPLKVQSVNRSTGQITLDAPLSGSQAAAALTSVLRSREFNLTITLLRRPDPVNPTRNNDALAVEVFDHLSMDPRHSRYVRGVLGNVDLEDGNRNLRLSDRRTDGGSWYVRVRDLAAGTAAETSVRLGPEPLVDVLPDGTATAARQRFAQGDDAIALVADADYVGQDAADPLDRTALHALRGQDDVSILAVPGRTGSTVQGALIAQCEELRYRFAVLDGPPSPSDSIADVVAQRQQFDTKYAALYHPWLQVPHPYPPVPTPEVIRYQIPPSGHVCGVYARTDVERGVHKSPANEVVRGILGLQQTLRKREQDVLNPFPSNINVIRDFRRENRGIRVYGGRVITSDSDWKYVNVRRLMIFIEASLDRGLQWVVFEPNAEPLWARVVRTVSNFLTVVWRNGALEGTSPQEAYFVRCDRTTMTQADIDNGRLICVIGVAPVKPAEFVIIRIGLWTAHADN